MKIEAAARLAANNSFRILLDFEKDMSAKLPFLKFQPQYGVNTVGNMFCAVTRESPEKIIRALNKLKFRAASFKGPKGFRTDGKWLTNSKLIPDGDYNLVPHVFVSNVEPSGVVMVFLYLVKFKK
jgi:hypothetical protein